MLEALVHGSLHLGHLEVEALLLLARAAQEMALEHSAAAYCEQRGGLLFQDCVSGEGFGPAGRCVLHLRVAWGL